MRIAAALSVVALIAGSPGAARAQAGLSAQLQAFVDTPQYRANIARLLASLPADVFQRCDRLVGGDSRVTVIKPVSFDASGMPVAGVWKQGFPVSGCGNDTTLNFLFAGQPGGKLASAAAVPGDTHADPVLQRDALQYVSMAAHAEAQDCTALHVRTTSYDGAQAGTAPVTLKTPWHETWTVAACGKILRVGVRFIPDATGTTIAAENAVPG